MEVLMNGSGGTMDIMNGSSGGNIDIMDEPSERVDRQNQHTHHSLICMHRLGGDMDTVEPPNDGQNGSLCSSGEAIGASERPEGAPREGMGDPKGCLEDTARWQAISPSSLRSKDLWSPILMDSIRCHYSLRSHSHSSFIIITTILFLLPALVSGTGMTLNIAKKPEGRNLGKVETVKENVRYTNFAVRKKTYITRIVDNTHLIWQAQSTQELCTYFTIYTFQRGHKLAYARIETGKTRKFLYYKFLNPGWEGITHAEYTEAFEFRSSALVFDVSARHNIDLFRISSYEPFGRPAFIFHPKGTKKIKYVTDGQLMLWRHSEQEKECSSVIVHKEGTISRFMQIIVKNGDTFDNRFLERCEHTWEFITKDSFYRKLEQMNEEALARQRAQAEENARRGSRQETPSFFEVLRRGSRDTNA